MQRSAASTDHVVGDAPDVLFVSDERGWPRTSGYRRRTSQLLTAVADVGPTLWVVAPRHRHDGGEPIVLPGELDERVSILHVPAPTRPRRVTVVRWLTSRLPWPLAAGDWRPVERRLAELSTHRFDLVWAMGIDAHRAIRRAGVDGLVTIVDADLESLKLKRQLEGGRPPGRLRRLIARVDHRRWRRLEHETAETVTGFSVCSERERQLLGGGAMTTPNGYPLVMGEPPTGPAVPSDVLLFVGSLSYAPNLDGLRWFTTEVLPAVRRRKRDVELRIVGSGDGDGLDGLAATPGVTVVGRVERLDGELARAGAVVVPILWGAGTRIKILEAFAHRVPVISTTIGAEGLDVDHERELMLADDPIRFADACLRVLQDRDLRDGLVDRGHETFVNSYEESAIVHGLTARLNNLIDSARSASPTSRR